MVFKSEHRFLQEVVSKPASESVAEFTAAQLKLLAMRRKMLIFLGVSANCFKQVLAIDEVKCRCLDENEIELLMGRGAENILPSIDQ